MSDDGNTQKTSQNGKEPTDSSVTSQSRASRVSHEVLRHFQNARNSLTGAGVAKRLLTIAAILGGALFLFWLVDKLVFYYLSRSYVDQVAAVLGLNKYLANALFLVTLIAVLIFARLLWSFSKRKRTIGVAGIAVLLIGHSLVLWYGTRNHYFDRSGQAIKCYVLSRNGEVSYGEQPGTDPITGRPCRPVTADMLERLKQYEAGKRPERVTEANPIFFDPRSGEPIIWYSKAKDNKVEIFDLMGFHPETGEELLPVTREIANEWKKQALEEARRVPRPISHPTDYVFFDPRTGQPRAWYWVAENGHYEFYDAPGFQPQTGDKLQVVTRDILSQWNDKQTNPMTPKKAPNRVQITKDTVFFDPVTGNPKLWYWRRDNGEYEFFDGPGFHPQNGQPLESFTQEKLKQYQSEIDERTKELRAEQDRIRAQQEAQQKAEEQQRIELQKAEEAEANKRAEQARRTTELAARCDDLAANPNDAQRVGQGVSYGELRPLAAQAIDACEAAIKQDPNELRFQYQLARALELAGDGAVRVKNRQRAMSIEQGLIGKGYAAAFDNLASMYRDRNDLTTAVPLFRKGIELGDTDSMVSLADLLNDQRASPQSPDESALALYKRAADLGNQNGARGYQVLIAKAQETQQQQVQQLENQRMMLQFMGAVLQSVPRR